MPREPIPTWVYALVVVRKGDRFLLVHERSHGGGWYLPAGRVEPGERIVDAAVRETREESGVPVALKGILRIEHTPRADGTARLRVVFLAEPVDDTPPKREPDAESLGADWFRLDELDGLTLRGEEVREVLGYVMRGGVVAPMEMLGEEGGKRPRPREDAR